MKFLHTADWQMGMRAESVGKMADHVREERLATAPQLIE
jgi:DNA repair exonuclease SbcCD nuclease subunit